jgi:hypothetical protein
MLITRAMESMGKSHMQLAIADPSEVCKQMANGDFSGVLKRDYSSHSRHIFSANTTDCVEKVQLFMDREVRAYEATSVFPRPVWFVQPFSHPLVHLGEIRAFVVNGILFRSVVTTPKPPSFEVQELVFPTPLAKLRYRSSLIQLTILLTIL